MFLNILGYVLKHIKTLVLPCLIAYLYTMKIIEKITDTHYIGQKETGVNSGTRFLIETETELNEGDVISKDNPITGKFQTLCELCESAYNGGEDYSEGMKQQAIDVMCGFLTETEIEFGI